MSLRPTSSRAHFCATSRGLHQQILRVVCWHAVYKTASDLTAGEYDSRSTFLKQALIAPSSGLYIQQKVPLSAKNYKLTVKFIA